MKKLIFLIPFIYFAKMASVEAKNILTVSNATLPQNDEVVLEVGCQFEQQFKGYQFDIELGEGLVLVLDEDFKPIGYNSFTGTDHIVFSSHPDIGKYRFVVVSMNNHLLPTNGSLLKMKIKCTKTIPIGTQVCGKIVRPRFTAEDLSEWMLEETSFYINIGDSVKKKIELHETSVMKPEMSCEVVDVQLYRNLKSDCWETIILPFNATSEQVKSAWGEDVKLAEIIACNTEKDANNDIVRISLISTSTRDISANTPLLIKASKDYSISAFNNVTLVPENESAMQVRKQIGEKDYFIGTYVSGGYVPKNNLFLSGNHFHYSDGTIPITGYRCFFELADILSNVDEAPSKVCLVIDGTTQIEDVRQMVSPKLNVYDLGGRVVNSEKLRHTGVYIVNGRKLVK